jgi:hypothetical protein
MVALFSTLVPWMTFATGLDHGGMDDVWREPEPGNLTQAEKLADPDGDERAKLEESLVGTVPWTFDAPGARPAPPRSKLTRHPFHFHTSDCHPL